MYILPVWLMHIVNVEVWFWIQVQSAVCIRGFEQTSSFCVLCRALGLEQYS